MKKIFCKTSNVSSFIASMNRLMQRQDGIPGMALVFGEPGLGKTRTVLWWCTQGNGVFIRAKSFTSGRWLLEELVAELGEAPMRRISDLFRQAVDLLMDRPRAIFVDECDFLLHDSRVVELLRDLYDTTGTPVILIGMNNADKKLLRFRHLFSRFSEIIKFHDLTESDVKEICTSMCEVKLSSDAVKYVYSQTNSFRRVVVQLYKAEAIARANSLKEVTAEHLNGARK